MLSQALLEELNNEQFLTFSDRSWGLKQNSRAGLRPAKEGCCLGEMLQCGAGTMCSPSSRESSQLDPLSHLAPDNLSLTAVCSRKLGKGQGWSSGPVGDMTLGSAGQQVKAGCFCSEEWSFHHLRIPAEVMKRPQGWSWLSVLCSAAPGFLLSLWEHQGL